MTNLNDLMGITPAEALEKLDAMQEGFDEEAAHNDADLILLQVLTHLGYGDVAEAFEEARDRVHFWYA